MDLHKLDYCFGSAFPAILCFILNGKHRKLPNRDVGICTVDCFVFRSFNEKNWKENHAI